MMKRSEIWAGITGSLLPPVPNIEIDFPGKDPRFEPKQKKLINRNKILTTACRIAYVFLLVIFASPLFSQNRQDRRNPGRSDFQENRKSGPGYEIPGNGNIILGCPTQNSIEANILIEKEYEGFIEYSEKSGKYNSRTPVFQGSLAPVEITISGLKESTFYRYRLNLRKTGESEYKTLPESWFSTAKNRNITYSFGVQGDSHPERAGKMFNSSLYKQTIGKVAERKPDFYFLMGDDFSLDRFVTGNQVSMKNVESVYKNQRYYLGNPGANPPLFLVNGNHEQAARYLLDGTPENIAVLAALSRNKFFPLPAPGSFYSGDSDTVKSIGFLKDYYSFEWGSALFIVIDPYWHSGIPVDNQPGDRGNRLRKDPWGITLGETQYNWLKKTLETSNARFKFVFAHHVNGTGRGGVERANDFEWGGIGQNGAWEFTKKRPGWQLPVHQLMAKNKVTIFFQGHDHLFAQQELDGVIYQTVPNPADDTYTAFNREAYKSGTILPNSGFLFVTVSRGEVKVEYVRSVDENNKSLDSETNKSYFYTIKK